LFLFGFTSHVLSLTAAVGGGAAVWAVVAVTVVLMCIAAFWHGLTVPRYEVESSKLKGGQFIRIVHISDLHSSRYGKGQEKLLRNIRELMPDLIFLTGDNIDDLRKRDAAYELLEGLKDLGTAVYFVYGNHELKISDIAEVNEKLRECGVNILDMSGTKIRCGGALVYIAGSNDPFAFADGDEYAAKFAEAFDKSRDIPQLKLLLSHRPEKWELYKNGGFDIAFSGHAHGGQVRIPRLVNGLFAPGQGLLPKRAGGIYTDEGFVHIVSRGLCRFWDLPRVFNPPELVLCVVKGTGKQKKNKQESE